MKRNILSLMLFVSLIASGQPSQNVIQTNYSDYPDGQPRRLSPAGDTTITLRLMYRWNLVSLPVRVLDNRVSALFPSAVSKAFDYEGGYQSHAELQEGVGYWLKSSVTDSVVVSGAPIYIDTIDVTTGWQIIGSISVPVDSSQIVTIPPNLISFPRCDPWGYPRYGCYYNTIIPGNAYWVKARGAGKVILKGW